MKFKKKKGKYKNEEATFLERVVVVDIAFSGLENGRI